MCTVTYFPKGNDHFILTSNRDENFQRATGTPEIQLSQSHQALFPQDPKSGGTWIAVSAANKLACLLNGAFVKHHHNPPYTRSRGLVLLDYFQYKSIHEFIATYDFQGIEPFTLVMYEPKNLVEFRWDGKTEHQLTLDLQTPYIWSSCTLYDEPIRQRRSQWFHQWLKDHRDPNIKDLMEFHRYGGEPDQTNGLVMNRSNMVQTLSITGIDKLNGVAEMYHQDLLDNKTTNKSIALNNEIVETN